MFEAAVAQGLFKIALGIVGVVMGRMTLKWMDVVIDSSDSEFSKWLENADGLSKAVYYAGRLLFVGIIVGSAIS